MPFVMTKFDFEHKCPICDSQIRIILDYPDFICTNSHCALHTGAQSLMNQISSIINENTDNLKSEWKRDTNVDHLYGE